MLYADDAGSVFKSAGGLAKMTTVIVTVFRSNRSHRTEHTTETMLLWTPNYCRRPRPYRSSPKQRDRGIDRRCSFCTWAVLSSQALA